MVMGCWALCRIKFRAFGYVVVFWGALARKCRFSCRATSFASGEAPDLFGYSLSNACGEECDVRQAMLTYGKTWYFIFSAGINTHTNYGGRGWGGGNLMVGRCLALCETRFDEWCLKFDCKGILALCEVLFEKGIEQDWRFRCCLSWISVTPNDNL